MRSAPKNLTAYEIATLPRTYNFTDGHAFRAWSAGEAAVIDRASTLFRAVDRTMHTEVELAYLEDFFRLGRQTWKPEAFGCFLCPNASMALEIVANFARLRGMSVTLIEPCFDNLADIFIRHGVRLSPFPDAWLEAEPDAFQAALSGIDTDAICLVTPNNPTGAALSEENLRRLARFCAERGKLLILDTCFRSYLPRDRIADQYRILAESGTHAVVIEDTGKTWPTAEIKAPFFAVTRRGDLLRRLYDIYTDFLLHVSTVGVRLVHEFVRVSLADDLGHVHAVVRRNRSVLHETLEGTLLIPSERPWSSVAWLQVNGPLSALDLKSALDEQGVFVLPGDYFYWHDRTQGRSYLRVALVRDADLFQSGALRLAEVVRKVADACAT